MESSDYPARTRQNVIDSDATLILYERRLKGGTLLTRRYAAELGKPSLCVKMERTEPAEVSRWLAETQPNSLNVAGPRESSYPGIEERALGYLLSVFQTHARDRA